MGRTGRWIEVAIAQNGTASSEADLGGAFRDVQVYSPAIDNATLTVKSSRNTGETAVQAHTMDRDATGDFANTTTAKTAAAMNIFRDIFAQYVTLVLGAAQSTADRTFYIRGIDPL